MAHCHLNANPEYEHSSARSKTEDSPTARAFTHCKRPPGKFFRVGASQCWSRVQSGDTPGDKLLDRVHDK